MARITVEDCLKQTGQENRFSLIHLALERVKQFREGHPVLVAGKNKEIVMALREIAAGIVTAENIKDFTKEKLAKKHVDEVSEEEEGTENSH
jgi:DNA-directed RNA polymerase subunit omega